MFIRLMILLLVCGIATADITFVLGGAGATSLSGGAFDPDQRTVDEAVGADGAPLFEDTGLIFEDISGSSVTVLLGEDVADADWIGVYATFYDSNGTEGAFRYIITAVDVGDDKITIAVPIDNGTTCSLKIGGAIDANYGEAGGGDEGEQWDLESVLDTPLGNAASQQVQILIYIATTIVPAAQIDIDSRGGSGVFYKRVIGVDSDYAPLTTGNYATYDMGVGDLGDNKSIFNIAVGNIRLENIAAMNPRGSSATPDADDNCFEVSHTNADNTSFINCKAVRGYTGFCWFNGAGDYADNGSLINCYSTNHVFRALDIYSTGLVVKGGLYDWGTAFTPDHLLTPRLTAFFDGVTFVGGTRGIQFPVALPLTVVNCNFIDQIDYAVFCNDAAGRFVVVNCIFDVSNTAVTKAIAVSGGAAAVVLNCITDADTEALAGFETAIDSTFNLDFTNSDPWVSISAGDYRVVRGGGIATKYVIDKGFVSYLGIGITQESKANLGPWNYTQIVRPRGYRSRLRSRWY